MRAHCHYCGKALPTKRGPGRRRRYCNRAHKAKAYRAKVRQLLSKARA